MSTIFRPTFLDVPEVLRCAPLNSKLWCQIACKQCELSLRESSKLDRVVERVQHFTKQCTATPTTNKVFDYSCNTLSLSNNEKQHRAAPSTIQQVVKRMQQSTEHECCTLIGVMLDSFDHGLIATRGSVLT